MAWIESHQELARHPKTRKLARLAGVSVPQAIGHLHLLWWWALDYAQDGDCARFEPEDLEDAMLWDGEPRHLWDALQEAGFMDGMAIHDWHVYGGRLLERRRDDAERKRTSRHRPHPAEAVSAGRPPDVHTPSGVTEQNSTGHTPQSPTVTAPRGGTPRAKPAGDDGAPDLAPLFEAFTALELPRPIMAGKKGGSEAGAARALLKHFPPGELAQCWQDIASGAYGDAFAQRDLSFSYLANRNRVANWQAWKAKPITARAPAAVNGRAPRPEAEHRWVEP
jgi:hypothetical protein